MCNILKNLIVATGSGDKSIKLFDVNGGFKMIG